MFARKRAETVNSTAAEPFAPLVVSTTGKWRGNDGSWSTFYINVGDGDNNGSGQNFEILPSTHFGVTVLPYPSSWCSTDCAENRGIGTVNGNQTNGLDTDDTTTWKTRGTYDLDLPYWWQGNNTAGAGPAGYYGLDYVGIGPASSKSYKAPQMYVAATTSKDFYIGQFGLGPGASNLGGGTGTPVDSIITFLKQHRIIPSVSYGYTAGAKYSNVGNGILGSFVLGGYDESRINMDNRVTISMLGDKNTSLVVAVQSISYKPDVHVEQNVEGITSTNGKGFRATIDSTFPYLWLPHDICDKFAEKFHLRYDNATNFYYVENASGAQNNDQQNAEVTFNIGSDPSGSDANFASIRLPYSAFELEQFNPGNRDNTIKYFPIRNSTNGMFVLGRTFLQEAYIVTDYGRRNFTVAQVPALDSLPEAKIVPIYDRDYVPPSPTPIPTGGGSKGLSGGAIAGIVIGVLAVALGVAFGIFIWWKKRRARKNTPPTYKEATEIDTSAAGNEVKHRRISELDTQVPGAPKSPLGGFYGEGTERKDLSPFPPISEMDSPPAELYSPPAVAATPHSEGSGPDYFTAGAKLGRRGATRESSAANTPGTPPPFTPIAELPAGDVSPIPSAKGTPKLASGSLSKRDPSATRSQSNIDEVMKREPSPVPPPEDVPTSEGADKKEGDAVAEGERRPSHTRGASDATVQSDTTVVSQPTPEELESWRHADDEHPRRPLSE
ncbi:acid protease [Paraphaeosphaeria sporulosa]|uniref:Acid protease n=1 Tax=Paraphaeosphaeria sporulosa TaxID=1460663 RepID=A0A177BWZ4_9PLEO|nr:acid protease [Paraphaeosphaeria sporulosa]OAF98839.1 acid protease [Paraphaeosphaeria sporulosa]